MRYRELVSIEEPTQVRSARASVSLTWSSVSGQTDIPATIVASADERRNPDMTIVEDRFDIVLAGRRDGLRPQMSVVDSAGRRYNIERIEYLLGGRQTRVIGNLVDSPTAAP